MGKRSSASLGAMRTRFPRLLLLCLCGALLTACASAPTSVQIRTTFEAGLKDYDAGDYAAAYKKWRSIENYDLAAMRNIALMLRTGKGVDKNPKAAQDMMEQAAYAGLATAQADLADMLIKGEAGPPDVKAAVPWLALAANAGHPIACFQLGLLYEQGTVVKQDIETARKLYKTAAAAGMAEAEARLLSLPPEPPRTTAAPQNPPSSNPPPALGH
jgi:uncharacterized protein